MSVLELIGGFALLAVASEHFVRGAARLATVLRVSRLVVGVVIVGFGTSLPEVLVSGLAAGRGDLGLAVGNMVGSNVANLALLLGAATLVRPLTVRSQTVRREAPITVVSVVLFAGFVQGGLSRLEGGLLLLALVAAMGTVLSGSRRRDPLLTELTTELVGRSRTELAVETARTGLGLLGTLAGAELLVRGGVDIAVRLGVGEGVIGLTLVALGTSLPELVTVVQASRHGESDLVVGNLLGSTVFNALFVGAIAALVGPGPLTERGLTMTGPAFMVALAALVWGLMWRELRVTRREGLALLVVYALFVGLVV